MIHSAILALGYLVIGFVAVLSANMTVLSWKRGNRYTAALILLYTWLGTMVVLLGATKLANWIAP